MPSEAEIEAVAKAIEELCDTDEDAAQSATLARAALEAAERVRNELPVYALPPDADH